MDPFASIPAPFPSAPSRQEMGDDDLHHGADSTNPQKNESNHNPTGSDDDDVNTRSAGTPAAADFMSDVSDEEEALSTAQRFAMAFSCKDEGTRLLKENNLDDACKMYRDGLKKLKNLVAGDEVKEQDLRDARLAFNLNLSLCYNRQSDWSSSIKCATAALSIDSGNLKALFRRGVARRHEGFLDEARTDLLRVCQLDKTNADARRELKIVNDKLAEARAKDRKAFGGLFTKSAGLYDDREKEREAKKKKEAEDAAREMEQYEQENKRLKEKGETPFTSFEAWKQHKAEAEKQPTAAATGPSKPTQTSSSVCMEDLDEEDKKILEETKKMGYCYFNRKVAPEEKEGYAAKIQPVRIDEAQAATSPGVNVASEEDENSQQRSLSSWNNRGTTYEEKDCSAWACSTLRDRLSKLCVNNDVSQSPDQLCDALSTVMKDLNENKDALRDVAGKLMPFCCKITSVDTLEGEAQVVVLRASKRYLYDFKIQLSFTLTIPNILNPETDPSTYSGTLHLTDVSSACSKRPSTSSSDLSADWLVDAKVSLKKENPLQPMHQPVWNQAVTLLKEALFKSLQQFELEFKAYS